MLFGGGTQEVTYIYLLLYVICMAAPNQFELFCMPCIDLATNFESW